MTATALLACCGCGRPQCQRLNCCSQFRRRRGGCPWMLWLCTDAALWGFVQLRSAATEGTRGHGGCSSTSSSGGSSSASVAFCAAAALLLPAQAYRRTVPSITRHQQLLACRLCQCKPACSLYRYIHTSTCGDTSTPSVVTPNCRNMSTRHDQAPAKAAAAAAHQRQKWRLHLFDVGDALCMCGWSLTACCWLVDHRRFPQCASGAW